MKLRLEIEVSYSLEDGSPCPESMLAELKANLLSVADNAASQGLLSGSSDAEIDTWDSNVTRLASETT